jgi:hypothetical protein
MTPVPFQRMTNLINDPRCYGNNWKVSPRIKCYDNFSKLAKFFTASCHQILASHASCLRCGISYKSLAEMGWLDACSWVSSVNRALAQMTWKRFHNLSKDILYWLSLIMCLSFTVAKVHLSLVSRPIFIITEGGIFSILSLGGHSKTQSPRK